MEFADRAAYAYLPFPLPMLALGWLGPELGVQGAGEEPVSAVELAAIEAASTRISSQALGYHDCEFCDEGVSGNGEYHYYLGDGSVWAAPVMMLHYLRVHDYRPPAAFRRQLLMTGRLAWDGRAEFLSRLLVDRAADFDLRYGAISDLTKWQDPRAFAALVAVLEDPEMIDLAAHEIGESLACFLDGDAGWLPEDVRAGVRFARGTRG